MKYVFNCFKCKSLNIVTELILDSEWNIKCTIYTIIDFIHACNQEI